MSEQITHFVSAAAALAVIYWRVEHPNQEHTLERKVFFTVLTIQFVWNTLAIIL